MEKKGQILERGSFKQLNKLQSFSPAWSLLDDIH